MEASATKPADNAEAKDSDLSMEEILQSIRRIIADEGDEVKEAKPAAEEVHGSDVLELTELLQDDGSVVSLKPEAPEIIPPAAPANDVLSSIDRALAPEESTDHKIIEQMAEELEEAAKMDIVVPVSNMDNDALLSQEAERAALSAFKKLRTEPPVSAPVADHGPAFRSGTTVEDLVADMLKPMMKAWLDANLAPIVEQIVEREVRRLTK